jgi:hypothetical protein
MSVFRIKLGSSCGFCNCFRIDRRTEGLERMQPWNLELPGRTGCLNRQTVGIGFASLKINRVSILKWGQLNTCRLRCRKV